MPQSCGQQPSPLGPELLSSAMVMSPSQGARARNPASGCPPEPSSLAPYTCCQHNLPDNHSPSHLPPTHRLGPLLPSSPPCGPNLLHQVSPAAGPRPPQTRSAPHCHCSLLTAAAAVQAPGVHSRLQSHSVAEGCPSLLPLGKSLPSPGLSGPQGAHGEGTGT